jgi:hypothetical protein
VVVSSKENTAPLSLVRAKLRKQSAVRADVYRISRFQGDNNRISCLRGLANSIPYLKHPGYERVRQQDQISGGRGDERKCSANSRLQEEHE